MAHNPVYTGSIVIEKPFSFIDAQDPPSPAGDTRKRSSQAPRWFVIAVIIITILSVLGMAIGLGIGLGIGTKKNETPASDASPVSRTVPNMTYVKNKLMQYIPVDMQEANTKELIESYLMQLSRRGPISQLLADLLPAVGLNNTSIQPQAIQVLLETWFEENKVDTRSLAATIDTLSQLAQGLFDYQSHVLTIVNNLHGVVSQVRQQLEALPNATITVGGKVLGLGGSAGGTLDGGQDLMRQQVFSRGLRIRPRTGGLAAGKAQLDGEEEEAQARARKVVADVVDAVLSSPTMAPYVDELRKLYDPDTLPVLVSNLYGVLMRLMAASDELRDIMNRLDGHFDLGAMSRYVTSTGKHSLPIYNHRTKSNLSTLAAPVPFDKRTTIVLTGPARRRLQQTQPLAAALLRTKLPAAFKPANSSLLPRVLVPLVFHIMSYRQDDTYGPPNLDKSPDYVDRLLRVVNAMALPTRFQFFVNEIRYDPLTNPYLLRGSRSSWLGYGWVPSSPSNITTGHVAVLWSVLDTTQWNSVAGWEYGAKVVWHEIMHHLGLYHTFGRSNANAAVCSSGSDDGIADTPIVAGPVYEQRAFSTAARAYCMKVFEKDLGSDWAFVMTVWANRLGIPPADATHGFDSCPLERGNDELGNYITYTHDVCVAALGHTTAGQMQYMHNFANQVQRKLYIWGQYFGALNPAAFKAPPKAPNPANKGGPCMVTRAGCQCKGTWSYQGQHLNGCANPDGDSKGMWCPVEQDGNCPSAINGYWDYCTADATEERCTPDGFRTVPAAPSKPPTPRIPCGPGGTTESGSTCTSDPWALVDVNGEYDRIFYGCANPDNDPQGSWCRLKSGHTTLQGRNWDYCGVRCPRNGSMGPLAPSSPPSPPPPPATPGGFSGGGDTPAFNCSTGYQGLPAGCSCRPMWGVALRPPFANVPTDSTEASVGRRYTTARYCTALLELQPPDQQQGTAKPLGICEATGCMNPAYNGRIMVCSTPCTILTWEDGEDVWL
ncbi:hypothetical protein VOLCADRAFT_88810 [Volvox carteri f. nagariensis]|uniref:Peptidase M43 pregnancy-associated plasma-A domain-containing protein n=1 Tax=Volvox carteri f. nagariensis TaxID=3068 RepID=D8TQ07_VOLCA|nr:uncharacterized protein VOLCADRAFT_88810 [Volvox carteri f. nagariensis]EFJ50321.1 hypothetical protein VOLCADRAFT_88810 [Volvox carteri f. nagariensis]|eukprot:XP_002948446.1 hypothetical protein VOLCADRAFT_88810 [Volvox carteri f. nagariensis]